MTLIRCPDCGKQVSNKASQCTKCARPIRKYQRILQFMSGLFVGIILTLCGVGLNWVVSKPSIETQILDISASPYLEGIHLISPSKVSVTKENATMLFPYVVIGNERSEPVTVRDFELDIDLGNGWMRAERATDADLSTWIFRSSDHTLISKEGSKNMIKPMVKIEKGNPVHGFLVFVITKPFQLIKEKGPGLKYRFTCIDASGKRHESKQDQVYGLNRAYLKEISNLEMINRRLSNEEVIEEGTERSK